MRQRYPSAFVAAETLMAHVSCCLLRLGRRNILVDTGMGVSDAPQSGLRGNLVRQMMLHGVSPLDIDTVVLTHLDADHTGGNVRREGQIASPAFANARYITSKTDWDVCTTPLAPGVPARFKPDHIVPLQHMSMLTIATGEMKIADGIRLIRSPGHTPGHMSLWVESEGDAMLLAGDAFYHPIQVPSPLHTFPLDMDRSSAEETRVRLLDMVESRNAYMWACHFPPPGIGRLVRAAGVLYWEPVDDCA
jgi:glyoxylase-like metal-dependent hydrolase (beta-lactamase superfamily II)